MDAEELIRQVIGVAIRVHRELGPGFLESVYEEALAIELRERGIPFERQKGVPIRYRDRPVGEHRLDLVVAGCLVVENKAVRELDDMCFAVVRSYMKATGLRHARVFNFDSMPLTIRRVGPEETARFHSAPPDLRS
jgi:GxxExxY protein